MAEGETVREDGSKVNRFMLQMEMILAAPGKGLHVLLGKLRRRADIGRALFLLCTLLLVGAGLWLMRRNTILLLIGGIALAVVAFLLYKPVLKGISTLLIFLEAFTHLFAKSYDDCRRSLQKEKKEVPPPEMTEEERRAEEERINEETRRRAREEKQRAEEEARAWQRAKQKARQEKRREQTEKKRRRMEEEAERERAKRGGPRGKTDPHPHESSAALQEAKSIFNLEIPFTEEELKEKRNLLIKKYHPDNPGGSEEMCKKINECYSILFKYAT